MKKIYRGFKSALLPMMGTVTHVITKEPVAALTFDDGPDPNSTPQLLDILKKYNAHATFFMVGKLASRYPELVYRVSEEGHAIGNHSWDHPSFPLIKGKERRAQIRACQKAIAPFGQRLFRPPYGDQSIMSRFDAFLLGYKVITWNLITIDWLEQNENVMANRIIENIQNGSIIIFHDSLYDALEDQYDDRRPTLSAVELVLNKLSDRFRFVTVTELLQCGLAQKTNWVQKPDVTLLNNLKNKYGNPRRYPYITQMQR